MLDTTPDQSCARQQQDCQPGFFRHSIPIVRTQLSGDDVGIPTMEDFDIGGASVKLFLPIFKMNFPEIVDIRESQRGSVPKPRVARNELPWVIVRK